MRYISNTIILVLLCAVQVAASAQADRHDVRRGNRNFRKENFREAEIDYRKALVKDSASFAASYNLANVLYRNGDMQQAWKSLDTLKSQAPASPYASDYYYNSGNVAAGMKNWQAAVDSYRESLLRNPGDMDAKENYIYAMKMLQNQQNQQNQNNQQNQDNKNQNNNDQNKDNQDNQKDQNQNQNQNQDQDQNNSQGQNQQDNQNGQNDRQDSRSQPKISPQAAQQMLKAIQAKEKETQEKVNKEKAEAMKSRQKEKNW